jgi:hypothetical protein
MVSQTPVELIPGKTKADALGTYLRLRTRAAL